MYSKQMVGTSLLSPHIKFASCNLFLCRAILPSWNVPLLSVNSVSFSICQTRVLFLGYLLTLITTFPLYPSVLLDTDWGHCTNSVTSHWSVCLLLTESSSTDPITEPNFIKNYLSVSFSHLKTQKRPQGLQEKFQNFLLSIFQLISSV